MSLPIIDKLTNDTWECTNCTNIPYLLVHLIFWLPAYSFVRLITELNNVTATSPSNTQEVLNILDQL